MKSNTILFIVSISILILVGISFPHNVIEGLKSGYYCKPPNLKGKGGQSGSTNYQCTSVKDDPSGASKYATYTGTTDARDALHDCEIKCDSVHGDRSDNKHGIKHGSGHGSVHGNGHGNGHGSGHGSGHGNGHGSGHGQAGTGTHSPKKTVDGSGNITFICENTIDEDGPEDHHGHHHGHHGHHSTSNSFDSFDVSPSSCGHHGF